MRYFMGIPFPRWRSWMRWPLVILGLGLFALAVWFGLPMTGWAPFATIWLRVTIIAVVVGLFLLIELIRWRRRVRAAREIEAALIPAEPEGDGKELAQRMETALATLKRSGGRSYLYDLPWYVIIGPPGAGKTTALVNSGIEFPVSQSEAVSGFAGTRFTDFWFAEDAVLIDTAGRYTTQDSDVVADKASWRSFLDLLKRSRPNQPINGVILAFSVEDMMNATPGSLERHAETVRARLAEIHETLKVDFPVYVMFTKADLIAGFREYFNSFSLNRRKLVWGTTFQTADRKALTHEAVPAEFDRLVARLSDEVIDRLSEEPDGIARIAIFNLPGQMALLRDNVSDFLRRVFEPTRYKTNAILRGFYFTSGTQEGTPIDQVLGAMAPIGQQGMSPITANFMSGRGKSYFIHDLLRRVIFPEQGWVSHDRRAVRRAAVLRTLAIAAILLGTLGLTGALGVSYWKNRNLVATASTDTSAYARTAIDEIKRDTITDPDVTPVVPLLDRLRTMPSGFGDSEERSFWERFGLGQRERVGAAATQAYSDALERMLRPRLILDMEQKMPAIIQAGDTTEIYRALKVYLLLGGVGEKPDDDSIKAWFAQDWRSRFTSASEINLRDRLAGHLDAMLMLGRDRNKLVDIDQSTVDDARAALAQLPLDEQAYAIVRDGIASSPVQDWSLTQAVGKAGPMVLTTKDGTDLSTQVVPAMYTYEGFWSYFYPQLEVVGARLKDDQWVLGDMADTAQMDERLARLDRDLLNRYREEFRKAWFGVLNNLTLTSMSADKPRYDALGAAASASASPLLLLVQSVDQQTYLPAEYQGLQGVTAETLAGGTAPATGGGAEGTAGETASKVNDAVLARVRNRSSGVQRILLEASTGGPAKNQASASGTSEPDGITRPIDAIAEDFEGWHALMQGEPGQRPIDALLGNLGAVWQNLRLGEMNPDQANAAMPGLLNNLTQYNSQLPEQLAALVTKADDDFQQGAADATLEDMNRALSDRVTFYCRENIANSYPFAQSSRSLSMEAFARFFGPGGEMDKYFTEYLEPYVERTSEGLRYRTDKPLAQRLSANALLQFQRAERIRQAYFAGGGTAPQVEITVAQVDAHPTVEAALLIINDEQIPTVTGALPRTVSWPGTGKSTVLSLSPALDRNSVLRLEGNAWTFIDFLGNATAKSQQGDTMRATFTLGGRSITYDFTINAAINPFTMPELRDFECPQSLD
ncbi:MAG: type VI secretion system membrane subunit TssM [Paracoccus denitrificans]|nr:MAG: type VI secretion system membrane subunit TssM [Paracoccus denitrificans]PZO86179.1 MAG: type VI secretion system membrane subunit TssM [Paracoccus denitrificans]